MPDDISDGVKGTSKRWRPRPDRDRHARALKQQFSRASAPFFRARARAKFRRKWALAIALGAAAFAATLYGFARSPWPPGETIRHVLAAPNCDAARLVGLAPARRSAAGYYQRHDADNDGVACEELRTR